MAIIHLQHYAKLGYPVVRDLPKMPPEIERLGHNSTLISFRATCTVRPDEVRKDIHACVRFNNLPKDDLIFYKLENDSPLAPLILWDAAHFLSVGHSITLIGDCSAESYLERSYYRGNLIVEKKDANGIVLRKIGPLPAEQDAGLARWSFCIPVGPEDATLLNVVVKRILEFDIPEKEILLCGRPGSNFKYWNFVRIVGEDITAPPVQICKKKNRLVDEARYENLCILHDRVFLPKDFYHAVCKFGDYYPFTAFQSLYFDDVWNAIPRRYSDFGRIVTAPSEFPSGVSRTFPPEFSPFSPTVFSEIENAGFLYSNPLRYERDRCYATGSLYLTKRSIWKHCRQNEALHWIEFEDVEHALRASRIGIPTRVNPHAITQSLINRPVLSIAGRITFEDARGKTQQSAFLTEYLNLPRKPLIRLKASEACKRVGNFIRKYAPNSNLSIPEYAHQTATTWLSSLCRIVQAAHFARSRNAITEFIYDYERWILLDQLPYWKKRYFVEQFYTHGERAKANLLEVSTEFLNLAAQRPGKGWFYSSLLDYLPQRRIGVVLGSFLSAVLLWKSGDAMVFHPKGLRGHFAAILKSTPYRDYAENAP